MPVENSVLTEVRRQLKEYLAQNPTALRCKCQQCLNDVVALTAKNLPARYTTSSRGRFFVNVELQSRQLQLDIFRHLTEAIARVNANPHHEELPSSR